MYYNIFNQIYLSSKITFILLFNKAWKTNLEQLLGSQVSAEKSAILVIKKLTMLFRILQQLLFEKIREQ